MSRSRSANRSLEGRAWSRARPQSRSREEPQLPHVSDASIHDAPPPRREQRHEAARSQHDRSRSLARSSPPGSLSTSSLLPEGVLTDTEVYDDVEEDKLDTSLHRSRSRLKTGPNVGEMSTKAKTGRSVNTKVPSPSQSILPDTPGASSSGPGNAPTIAPPVLLPTIEDDDPDATLDYQGGPLGSSPSENKDEFYTEYRSCVNEASALTTTEEATELLTNLDIYSVSTCFDRAVVDSADDIKAAVDIYCCTLAKVNPRLLPPTSNSAVNYSAYLQLHNLMKPVTEWTAEQSDVVIPGPWHHAVCFYMDLQDGKCYRVDTDTDLLTWDEILANEDEIWHADQAEIKNFIDHKVFRVSRLEYAQERPLSCVWVRKWVWRRDMNGKWVRRAKCRLCCRGFLDPQKALLSKHSTTATRLSQKILVSDAAIYGWPMESWDVSSAFLQGFNFKHIEEACRALGIPVPTFTRKVYIVPPANVWFHLRYLGFKNAPSMNYALFCLELLKAMYGLNDAPLLWQCCLRYFLKFHTRARCSLYDDNFYSWYTSDKSLAGEATAHVDDANVAGRDDLRKWLYKMLTERFGTLKVEKPPMVHIGLFYERLPSGGYKLHQADFCVKMKTVELTATRKSQLASACTASEHTQFRAVVGALLYLCFTRVDIVADVVTLQQYVQAPLVSHIKEANALVRRAQQEPYLGLLFLPLPPPWRFLSIGDASGASTKTSYAIEGGLALRMSDAPDMPRTKQELCGSWLNGTAHILVHSGKRAKRISHSTSHGETLAMNSIGVICEMIAMRFTELVWPWDPTLDELITADQNGQYNSPIDSLTDCKDLWELLNGLKGVPQDKSQRLIILSLREKRVVRKVRRTIWMHTSDMVANPLTKHDTTQPAFYELLRHGRLRIEKSIIVGNVLPRNTQDYTEQDLLKLTS